ncbi:MAG TPA: hypothetical protein VFE54_08730, partial [Mucilaginibacter sp.]|nr:hypothetical protein [Mucilaginibacter sp.]
SFNQYHMKKIILMMICCAISSYSYEKPGISGKSAVNLFTIPSDSKGYNSNIFFKLDVKPGDKLGNIFSRTISYKSADFSELVFRAAGTGVYTVVDNNSSAPVFNGVFRYDGRPESSSKVEVSDNGKTVSYDGKSATNTDGSGVLFNSLIWGNPPATIHKGDSWKVNIPQAWELGGPGMQTVTVLDIDDVNHTIRLKREGNSEGFFDNDIKQLSVTKDGKVIKMDVTPGSSHWVGYTTFKNGLVISDELMTTRSVVLTADNLKFEAQQREYILLNAMPVAD